MVEDGLDVLRSRGGVLGLRWRREEFGEEDSCREGKIKYLWDQVWVIRSLEPGRDQRCTLSLKSEPVTSDLVVKFQVEVRQQDQTRKWGGS